MYEAERANWAWFGLLKPQSPTLSYTHPPHLLISPNSSNTWIKLSTARSCGLLSSKAPQHTVCLVYSFLNLISLCPHLSLLRRNFLLFMFSSCSFILNEFPPRPFKNVQANLSQLSLSQATTTLPLSVTAKFTSLCCFYQH